MHVARGGHQLLRIRLLEQGWKTLIRAVVAEERAILPGGNADREPGRFVWMVLEKGRFDPCVNQTPHHPDSILFTDHSKHGNPPAKLSQSAGRDCRAAANSSAEFPG